MPASKERTKQEEKTGKSKGKKRSNLLGIHSSVALRFRSLDELFLFAQGRSNSSRIVKAIKTRAKKVVGRAVQKDSQAKNVPERPWCVAKQKQRSVKIE